MELEETKKHSAATTITKLYRKNKAKSIVENRRHQVALEFMIANTMKYESMWIPFQCLVRRYVTRCWFAKHGVNFKLNRKSRKKRPSVVDSIERKVSWSLLLTRIEWEVHQRRINARADLLYTFQEKY